MVRETVGGRERDGERVDGRGERGGRVRSVSARRILQTIEVEHEFTRFIEAVGGKAGVEKTGSAISGGGAGRVTKNEEKFWDRGVFKNGLQPKCFSREIEFRSGRNGLIVAGPDERSERDGLLRRIGNPSGDDAKSEIGLEPFESAKTGDGRRMSILNAKSEAGFAPNHIHVESGDCEMRGNIVLVGLRSEGLRFCGSAGNEEVWSESSRGRIQRNGFAFEVKDGEMSGSGREMDFVVGRGTSGIVPGLKPLEADEREPAVGLEEVRFVLLAPDSVFFLPGSFLREGNRGQQRHQKGDKSQAGRTVPEAHDRVYLGREKAGNAGQPEGAGPRGTSAELIVNNKTYGELQCRCSLTKSIF